MTRDPNGDIPPGEAKAYWGIVVRCLQRFHGLAPLDAEERMLSFRTGLALRLPPNLPWMIYHQEPFDVACRLARNELDWTDPRFHDDYLRMLDEPFPDDGEGPSRTREAEFEPAS